MLICMCYNTELTKNPNCGEFSGFSLFHKASTFINKLYKKDTETKRFGIVSTNQGHCFLYDLRKITPSG